MLARARSRAAAAGRGVVRRIDLVEGDAPDVRVPGRGSFRLAFVALNSLFMLADASGPASGRARPWPTISPPGGLAVVDVWLPDADDLARYDGRLVLEYIRRDPGDRVDRDARSASALHDAATATVTLTTIYDEGEPGAPAVRWIRRDDAPSRRAPTSCRASAEAAGLGGRTRGRRLRPRSARSGRRPGDPRRRQP